MSCTILYDLQFITVYQNVMLHIDAEVFMFCNSISKSCIPSCYLSFMFLENYRFVGIFPPQFWCLVHKLTKTFGCIKRSCTRCHCCWYIPLLHKRHFLEMFFHNFLDLQPITRTSFVISKVFPHLRYKEQHGMHTAG